MISKEEILSLAKLARLELDEAEVARLQTDITNVLSYVDQIGKVELGDTALPPLSHNVLRADEPRAQDDLLAGTEEVIRAAFPKRQDRYNAVPKILQRDE